MKTDTFTPRRVAIIGAGPAGLMAAEVMSRHALEVHVFEAKSSVARKLLMAGKSGLNLTHAEAFDVFLSRFGDRRASLTPILQAFGPQALRDWANTLGIETFVGSSGRVFPVQMKAAPLLRAWLRRLHEAGVHFHLRHHWQGWQDTALRFATPAGDSVFTADATVLALGGGSWPRLGSTGDWVPHLQQAGIDVRALLPANCGFDVNWSEHLRSKYAGQAVKSVRLGFTDEAGQFVQRQGEFVISHYGIEGSLVYGFAALLREYLKQRQPATLALDLLPDWSLPRIADRLAAPRGKQSMSEYLRRRLGLSGVKLALVYELLPRAFLSSASVTQLAQAIKTLPIACERTRPLQEAISTAGGVRFDELDSRLMLHKLPGVFCAGEMLDWEAPTGGYLLTACFASGYVAGLAVTDWL